MAVQLFSKQQDTGEYVCINLFDADPIKLNLSVADIIDPTATNSVFSRTFKVPNTDINSKYFKGVFNVNSLNFDAAAKADAYILDNGIFFQNGNIRLNSIYVNTEDNNIQYEITFYGSTSDFGSKIGGGFLNEVNLNKFNHSKDYANITASWNLPGLFDGDVVYGLIEWGYPYNDKNQPSLPTLSTNFAVSGPAGNPAPKGSFTNPLFPYRLEQWKPQIRAKALWDQIFEEAGYTYDSEFLSSEFFKKQYIISDNQAQATLDNSNEFKAFNQQIGEHLLGETFQWLTPVEESDPGNNYNPTTGIYTAPAAGVYEFEMNAAQVQIPYFSIDPGNDLIVAWQATLVDVITGVPVAQDTDQWSYGDFTSNSLNAILFANLEANQQVKFVFRTFNINLDPNIAPFTRISYVQQQTICRAAPNIMSFNGIMPSNIRKIDFMKSIINKYRLVFEPSKFEANHFTITPWKDWILEGKSKDWTARLDISKDMVIKPLFFDQARFQIYKDQEDSDYLNYNYQLGVKQTFGQLNLDSTNELIKGTKEYKDQFAPTPLDGIGWRSLVGGPEYSQAAKFLIPHMAKDTGGSAATQDDVTTGKREPIQPKLRLVFYNGMKAAPITWYMATNSLGVEYQPRTSYPLMSQYSEFPVTSTTFDLNWQNQDALWDIEVVGGGDDPLPNPRAQTAFSCFNTFWKTWYDITFDPYSRLVEANFTLDYNELLDLKFNDYIFVKDAWYFVNSVSDYVVGQTSNCRVQLVKLGNNAGITIPDISPSEYTPTPTCYHQSDVCVSHCCFNFEGAEQVTIYTNGDTLITSTFAYVDRFGGILAESGYYSDVSGTVLINSNGFITPVNTSSCDCVPDFYTFSVHINETGCDVCCYDGPLVTVYGANPIFLDNNSFYTNQLLTEPSPIGFYKQTGAAEALQVGNNGNVLSTFVCDTCLCEPYYPFVVCAASTLCVACCCGGQGGTSTVWGTNPTFANNTTLYIDNAGGAKVNNGFYKLNNSTVVEVTGGEGAVTAITNCTSCPPCPTLPVTVEVVMFVNKGGYVTTTILQKSYDNGANWVDVGTSTIDDIDDNSSSVNIFTVEEGVRLRAINSSTVIDGNMNTNYKIDLTFFDFAEDTTPASRIVTIPSATVATSTYQFSNSVLGGETSVADVYAVGIFNLYQGSGWPTGGSIGSILGLDAVADINTTFDVSTGFIGGGTVGSLQQLTQLAAIDSSDDSFFVSVARSSANPPRTPVTYKGTTITKSVVKLDYNGNLNTTFQNNYPRGLTFLSPGVLKVYSNRLYAVSSNNVDVTDLNGVTDPNFTPPTNWGNLAANIKDIIEYNGLLYLTGLFRDTTTIPGTITYTPILVLNQDGTVNLTETNKFTYVVATIPTQAANKCYIYDNKIYLTGNLTFYKATTIGRFAVINISTGDLDPTFIIGTGFNSNATIDVAVDQNGIYVGTNAVQYNGAFIHPLVKLNHNGSQNTSFVTGSILDINSSGTFPLQVEIDRNTVYICGTFTTINNIPSSGIAKINGTTGALDLSFDVNSGFTSNVFPASNCDVRQFYVKRGAQTELYPLYISYSSNNACAAHCATPKSTVIYGNGISLTQSTILYTSISGNTFVAAGWYADGGIIAEVDTNGIIIGYTDTINCICNSLYAFDVTYDPEICISCGTIGTPISETVYGSNQNWSSNTVLYANQNGTIFANQGWYAYNYNIVLQVGSNGYVTSSSYCNIECGSSSNCAGYQILNTSGQFINWVYYECTTQNILYGQLYPGEVLNTPCIIEGTFQATGSYTILNTAIC